MYCFFTSECFVKVIFVIRTNGLMCFCRVPPRLESLHNTAVEKWHFAYHGMCLSDVRKLLDAGDLLAVCSE